MKTEKIRHFKIENTLFVMIFALLIFTASAFAKDFKIDMQGSAIKIPLGNTITKKLDNIPSGLPGLLKLRLKWHAESSSLEFNALRVRVIHGSRILSTSNCYSIHANRDPKCRINLQVNKSEAEEKGSWKLEVTNNSKYEVSGFNIEKGNDTNALVPNFKSIYEAKCPGAIKLDMEGTTLTLQKGNTQLRKIYRIGKSQGVLNLKAKWHTTGEKTEYNKLKIELLKPNGQVAKTGEYYSLHAKSKFPKFEISYKVSAADAGLLGTWKLRITNNSKYDVKGFNIERESTETNRLIPVFESTFRSICSA